MSQIEFNAIQSKNTISFFVEKLPNITLIIAAILRLVLLCLVAFFEAMIFWKDYTTMAFIVGGIIVISDFIFTLTSIITARFWYADKLSFKKSKSKKYAAIFFLLSVAGTGFSMWRLFMFAEIFEVGEAGQNVLKFLLVSTCFLAFIFSEGGAFMLFTFSSKEERNNETSETRNSETGEKQAENDVSEDDEETTQGKIEELPLPKSIQKTGEDKYSINNELPKTYEQLRGNMRANRSAKNKFKEAGLYRKARNSEVLENYYNYVLETIDFQNKEVGELWKFFPNGSLADDTQAEQKNGHKLEHEFFQ